MVTILIPSVILSFECSVADLENLEGGFHVVSCKPKRSLPAVKCHNYTFTPKA